MEDPGGATGHYLKGSTPPSGNSGSATKVFFICYILQVEQEFDEDVSLWTDRIMFMASVAIFVFYNLIFVIYVLVKV